MAAALSFGVGVTRPAEAFGPVQVALDDIKVTRINCEGKACAPSWRWHAWAGWLRLGAAGSAGCVCPAHWQQRLSPGMRRECGSLLG